MSKLPTFAEAKIEQYRPLIKNRARSFHRGWLAKNATREELEAVATVAVWQAAEHHDDARGAKFGTYVVHVVDHALLGLKKYWLQSKRMAHCVSLSPAKKGDLAVVLPHLGPGPAAASDAAEMRQIVREAVDSLAPRLSELVERRFWREETLQQIGESWGLSRERIRQLEEQALNELRPRLRHVWFGSREAA